MARLSGLEREYSDLMRELWGSPGRWNSRRSYVDVARKIGVDEETVRNRLKRLKESGFLVGWRLLPNPSLFGRSSTLQHLSFDGPAEKEAAVAQLKEMEGAVVVASLYGPDLVVTLFDSKDRACSSALRKLSARGGPTEWRGMGLPQSRFRMTTTDWQIAGLMLRNAERSVAEVAAQVKVSVRTVKRRLDKMMEASAIFIMPIVDQTKSMGVSYQVMVETREGEKPRVDGLVTSKIENLVFRAADDTNNLIYGFTGRNVAEGKELLDWLRRLPGVKSVRINIVEEVVYAFKWLEREISRAARAR